MVAAAPPDSPTYAEAVYWRAALAASPADAERDYRRLVVEYWYAPHLGDALVQLAQMESARGDRAAATEHLERYMLEAPSHPDRARDGLMLVRLLFDQNDVPRGCVAWKQAMSAVPSGAVELRNQLSYYSARCTANDVSAGSRVPVGYPPGVTPPVPAKDTSAAHSDSAASTGKARFTLQVAAYQSKTDATHLVTRLAARGRDGASRRVGQALSRSRRAIRHAHGSAGRAETAQGQEARCVDHRDRSGRQVTTMSTAAQTPLMQQYREIKSRHENAILFFRMGEFYEMFYDDAETASRVLGLTLTSRNNGGASDVPLAGVPVKAAGDYVRRLVQQGFRVAICEQTEDPKQAKGVVRREVVETVTPGVAFSDDLLDGTRNNFICAILVADERHAPARDAAVGVAAADVSTGEVRLIDTTLADLDPLMARLSPREILVPSASQARLPSSRSDALVTEREAWEFDAPLAREDLTRQYGVLSLDGFGLDYVRHARHRRGGSALPLLARTATGGTAAARASDRRAAGRGDAARRDDASESRAGRVTARRRHRRNAALGARPHRHTDGCASSPAMDPRAAHEPRGDRVASRRRREIRRRSHRSRSDARRGGRRARRRATRREGRCPP